MPIADFRLALARIIFSFVKDQLAMGNWKSAMFLAVAEGFEPSHGRINSAVPYQLGYATRKLNLAAATRLELVSSRLQDERSEAKLSYAAIWWTGRDSNPHKKFAGLLCCRLHHQPNLSCESEVWSCESSLN
jgi:hypothetical protein